MYSYWYLLTCAHQPSCQLSTTTDSLFQSRNWACSYQPKT